MTQDEFKRALVLLQSLSFEDLLATQQVLERQVGSLDSTILDSERAQMIFALHTREAERKLIGSNVSGGGDRRAPLGVLIGELQRIVDRPRPQAGSAATISGQISPLSNCAEAAKQYIALAFEVSRRQETGATIDKKSDKLLQTKANHIVGRAIAKKNIQQTLKDIESAKFIVELLSGKGISLQDFLRMEMSAMRGVVNV